MEKCIQIPDLFERRILLVTGKGGVGKTTVAAAMARMAAAIGKRVLALDTERDLHSPSQLLRALGGPSNFDNDEPYELTSHLYCARLSSKAGHHKFLEDNLPFKWLAKAAANSKYIQSFLAATPGFQELGILYRILPYVRQKDTKGQNFYDLIITDLPATGHALALTSMPKPMLSVFESGPIASSIREAQGYFNNPECTGFVVVSLPEPLVVNETIELIQGLFRDQVDPIAVFLNNIPPDPFDQREHQTMNQLLTKIPHDLSGISSYQQILHASEAKHQLAHQLAQLQKILPLYYLRKQPDLPAIQRVSAILEDLWMGATLPVYG
jgi:anion-transporting  ArsA/GET3 family ATPase